MRQISMKKAALCGLSLGLCATALSGAHAQALRANDNAADPAYNGGWTTGTNGGTGFKPWILSQTNNNNGGFFIGDSNLNGSTAGPGINSSGKTAFGLYANSGVQATATRPLTGSLAVGQTISLDFDNGYIDNGGSAGFYFANSTGASAFTFSFTGGDNQYRIADGNNATGGTGLSFTDGGLHTYFALTSPSTYSFTATRLTDNATYTQTGLISASPISSISIFNNHAGSGDQPNVYANNLHVAPAPSALLPMTGGLVVLFGTLRRRRK